MVLDWDTLQIVDNISITQNITTQNPTWTPEDMGLGNVPTFGIKQQYYPGERVRTNLRCNTVEVCSNLVHLFQETMIL